MTGYILLSLGWAILLVAVAGEAFVRGVRKAERDSTASLTPQLESKWHAGWHAGHATGKHDGWRDAHKAALHELATYPTSKGGKLIVKALAKGPTPEATVTRTTAAVITGSSLPVQLVRVTVPSPDMGEGPED